MQDRNSILYNFPVQFPFGPNYCVLNGMVFTLGLFSIILSLFYYFL